MVKQNSEEESVRPLTLVVCIKQVPLVSAMRFDQKTRRLIREGVPLEINELDVYALIEAIRLRDMYGGEVIAITMGSPQAHEALSASLAIGVNPAIHINGLAFARADTPPTPRTQALTIQPIFTTPYESFD